MCWLGLLISKATCAMSEDVYFLVKIPNICRRDDTAIETRGKKDEICIDYSFTGVSDLATCLIRIFSAR